jgi:hypothetical protein
MNIREYGAIGDGKTKDHRAIQAAIDACAASGGGGGRVIVPAGRYLCGTIYLKSHIELHLLPGARIVGSPDREDYNADDVFPENNVFSMENVTGAHLVIAHRCHDVAITGQGTIDGNSAAFFDELGEGEVATYLFKSANYPIKNWRPGQMVLFSRCQRIAVRDVALIDSPYWTVLCHDCEDVQVRGVRITNPPATQNGDGLDLDCCRRVTVSDCIIQSGDDAITVRANTKRFDGDPADYPSEDIVVSNCVLSSPCNGIRVGVGNGYIRRCRFDNIVMPQVRTAVNMISRYSANTDNGVCLEQVDFTNFTVNAACPIAVGLGVEPQSPAAIRDVSFRHWRITASAASQFIGNDQLPLERIRLCDIEMHIVGGTSNTAYRDQTPDPISHYGYPGLNDRPALPCALYVQHVDTGLLDDVRVRWSNLSKVWRDGVIVDRCNDVVMQRMAVTSPSDDGQAVRVIE